MKLTTDTGLPRTAAYVHPPRTKVALIVRTDAAWLVAGLINFYAADDCAVIVYALQNDNTVTRITGNMTEYDDDTVTISGHTVDIDDITAIYTLAAPVGSTTFSLLYRDTSNNKARTTYTLAGSITDEERAAVEAHTIGPDHLIFPEQVGMPNPRADLAGEYDDDPEYCELEDITVNYSRRVDTDSPNVHDFAAAFIAHTWKTTWKRD